MKQSTNKGLARAKPESIGAIFHKEHGVRVDASGACPRIRSLRTGEREHGATRSAAGEGILGNPKKDDRNWSVSGPSTRHV